MTAKDAIARVLFDEGGADERVRSYEIADALVAAIRAMPVEDQAELIGAESVDQADGRTALYVGKSLL